MTKQGDGDPGFWQGRSVLVTGACGTVGRELLRQVLRQQPARVVALDNNESELFFLGEDYSADPRVEVYMGDVRDRDQLMRRMRGVDVVLHAAALKHVPICERTPEDAIMTNILGVQHIIEAAIANEVGTVLFTSSDKAVNPTNVMGTSKLMGERLVTAAHTNGRNSRTIFASTRFGNVLGSRGSVIPLFKQQIRHGGPVTLTDPRMTRFIMTLEQAVTLVMESAALATGGEVFVTKMPVIRITDLVAAMIAELAPRYGHAPERIAIAVSGPRPGEKLYEELMNDEEMRRTVELEKYFVILPALRFKGADQSYGGRRVGVDRPYNSANETVMDMDALKQYLRGNRLLDEEQVSR